MSLSRRQIDESAPAAAEFRIALALGVEDAEALWDAAAARTRAAIEDATDEDVEEMLGPREDPSIADCIALLASPAGLAGCTLLDFAVEERGAEPSGPRPGPHNRPAIALLKR